MKLLFILFVVLTLLSSCSSNKIDTASTLTSQDIKLLHSLNVLDNDEIPIKFYSEYRKNVAGNFYTDKRLESYWLDKHDTTKDKVEFAFYKDIIKIDTVSNAGATFCPYLLVTKKDSSSFKVCVDGKQNEVSKFFNEAINLWKQSEKLTTFWDNNQIKNC